MSSLSIRGLSTNEISRPGTLTPTLNVDSTSFNSLPNNNNNNNNELCDSVSDIDKRIW
ncbi:hypothetical protein Phum_PHUM242870 [Pediculus humanus corporis]|uniref:Uncharacterized protein n=1 Tax=Pediculus humanus subsp. corporis TaxID=121224 RepID=E0VJC7_PEDHC|nr:uncharacterized protein Phum_PHUM242870 [Pediculus humanus corporis]EEB13483.1 hypothetical protein Phum_PHUM242870 [Pediculus humanus corporis]